MFVLGETYADSSPEADELSFDHSSAKGKIWLACSGTESCEEVLIQC